jgi:hypothetical protein
MRRQSRRVKPSRLLPLAVESRVEDGLAGRLMDKCGAGQCEAQRGGMVAGRPAKAFVEAGADKRSEVRDRAGRVIASGVWRHIRALCADRTSERFERALFRLCVLHDRPIMFLFCSSNRTGWESIPLGVR